MKIQFRLLQPSYLKFYLTLVIPEQYISISIHIQLKKNNCIYKYVIVTDMPYFDHLNIKIIKITQHLKKSRSVHFRQLFCRFYFLAA